MYIFIIIFSNKVINVTLITYYDERNIFNEMSVDRESERRPPIIISDFLGLVLFCCVV